MTQIRGRYKTKLGLLLCHHARLIRSALRGGGGMCGMEWAVNFCQALRCVWQLRLWQAGWGGSVGGGR